MKEDSLFQIWVTHISIQDLYLPRLWPESPTRKWNLHSGFVCCLPCEEGSASGCLPELDLFWISNLPSISQERDLDQLRSTHVSFKGIFFLCVFVFCLHVYLCTMCVSGVSSPGTGSWKLKFSPLQGQPVLLTTESSLQFLYVGFEIRAKSGMGRHFSR